MLIEYKNSMPDMNYHFMPNTDIYLMRSPVADDRIYHDSKGRPVGLAAKVNRVTHSVEKPQIAPLMTPEDKIYFDACFERCLVAGLRILKP